jgi:hypothetical protein
VNKGGLPFLAGAALKGLFLKSGSEIDKKTRVVKKRAPNNAALFE